MINLYPVKIEAYDGDELVFRLDTFDAHSAVLTMTNTMVNDAMLPELFCAIQKAVMMMKLKTGADE